MTDTVEQEHSPLPWSLDYYGHVVDANGQHICSNGRGGNNPAFIEQGKANMALIAKMGACHDELVAACEALLVMGNTKKPRKLDAALTWKQNDILARDKATAILAKAEKGI